MNIVATAVPYPLLCAVVGFGVGWLPMLFHGPIAEKFDLLYIQGNVAVWGWYVARLSIGLLVGITWWPRLWYLRGPLCGLLAMIPLGLVSLATPGCGATCMFWNCTTAILIGIAAGGIAYQVTGRHSATAGEG